MKKRSIGILLLAALTMPAVSRAESDQAAVIAKEKAVWEAFKAKSPDAFDHLIAGDMVAVDAGGIADKAAVMKSISDIDLKDYALSDLRVVMPSPNTAIVTYKASQHGTYKGQELSPTVYASSVWVKRSHHWVGVFHQETPAAPAP